MNEGWAWLFNSPKWHYFRDGRSLCGRWACLCSDYEKRDTGKSNNCKACDKKRAKEEKVMNADDKLPMCKGCRNDFYNQGSNSTTGRCWSLEKAKIVKRFRIGWWTQPIVPGAFTEVVTLDCHHAMGQYAQYDKLPDNAVEPRLLKESQ